MKNRQYNIISELSKNLIHADEQIDAYDNFLSAWQYFVANQKKGGGIQSTRNTNLSRSLLPQEFHGYSKKMRTHQVTPVAPYSNHSITVR